MRASALQNPLLREEATPSLENPSTKMGVAYRPDIDGLRAVAILSVLGYHFFPDIFKGGFLGVDIFFVISGYLITKLILVALENKNFNFRNFLERRVRRLFPALIIVFSLSLLYGFATLLPSEFKDLCDNVLSGTLFYSNFYLYKQSGYFQPAADLIPFLHIWSLSIEEQFYICCSMALVFLYKIKFNKYLPVLLLFGMAASVAFNIYLFHRNSDVAFYFPVCRFWEFGLGSVVAYWHIKKIKYDFWISSSKLAFMKRLNGKHLSFMGLSLLAFGLFFIVDNSSYSPTFALIPTLGATLIIANNTETWIQKSPLSNKLFVMIGLISYPLYLLHWPLLSFSKIFSTGHHSYGLKLLILATCFLVSYLVYVYVETPIRTKKLSISYLIAPMLLITGLTFLASKGQSISLPGIRNASLIQVSQANVDWDFAKNMKHYKYQGVYDYYEVGRGEHKILFLGDSNMQQYAPRISKLILENEKAHKTAIFATYGGTPPIPGLHFDEHRKSNFMSSFFSYLKEHPVNDVVICSAWTSHLSNTANFSVKIGDNTQKMSKAESYAYALSQLEKMIRSLVKNGKRVYIILAMPSGSEYSPTSFVKRDAFGHYSMNIPTPSKEKHIKASASISADLKSIARKAGAIVIDPADELCDDQKCMNMHLGEFIYKDGAHLRTWYVENHFKSLDKIILDN